MLGKIMLGEDAGLMNVAFLFNSDDPKLGASYGLPIMESILATKVLQSKSRNMRVSIGDILTFMAASTSSTPTYAYLHQLCLYILHTILTCLYMKDSKLRLLKLPYIAGCSRI